MAIYLDFQVQCTDDLTSYTRRIPKYLEGFPKNSTDLSTWQKTFSPNSLGREVVEPISFLFVGALEITSQRSQGEGERVARASRAPTFMSGHALLLLAWTALVTHHFLIF